jgi:uncharacterized cupin superfamily protein
MDVINISSAENLDGRIDVSRALGSTETLMFIYDLAPGQGSSPYHYEYDEEWLLVVEGTVVVRAPDGEHSDAPARTLLFSHARGLAVSVYPDSDTIGVFAGDVDDLVFRRGTAVPWAHGEEGWNKAD